MINHIQVRELIIEPALTSINLYSPEAEEMLIAMCSQQNEHGLYLKQPFAYGDEALGIFKMPPSIHEHLWNSILLIDPNLGFKVMTSCRYTTRPKAEIMVYNLFYAAVMAMILLLSIAEPLPDTQDVTGIWNFYKRYLNWSLIAKQDFIQSYETYIKGV